jgi:hypothetical protein
MCCFVESPANEFAESPAYARDTSNPPPPYFYISFGNLPNTVVPVGSHNNSYALPYDPNWPSAPLSAPSSSQPHNGRWVQSVQLRSAPVPFLYFAGDPGMSNGYWYPDPSFAYPYMMITCTGIDLVPGGIWTVVFNKAWTETVNWSGVTSTMIDIPQADQMAVFLIASDGTRIQLSATDNVAGFSTLPSGITSQVDNGDGTWSLTFDSRILFGSSKSFRGQMVFPGGPPLGSDSTTNADTTVNPGTSAWAGEDTDTIPVFYTTPIGSGLGIPTVLDYGGFPPAYAYSPGNDPAWTAQSVTY